ncbi:hypothetical protein L2E82_27427 [Cichorium intybus]|uniref:Uncharacterized protein n=1 Tax=Cichorium intybus TaxID=13427 RepID=A0ACB9CT41_CICIN|nr:hypothetical protein L2E82_27427 [Cichorium intybus]
MWAFESQSTICLRVTSSNRPSHKFSDTGLKVIKRLLDWDSIIILQSVIEFCTMSPHRLVSKSSKVLMKSVCALIIAQL